MKRVAERLRELFCDVNVTEPIVTPAYGMPATAAPYANLLAEFHTTLGKDELLATLKQLERELGDSDALRREGIVVMDLDLLQYGDTKHHADDWQRPYVKMLLKALRTATACMLLMLTATFVMPQQAMAQTKKQDTELLGKAVDYYNGGKYHESILAFERLQKRYRLNPRFQAYLGICYFKERQYKEAAENLRQSIPQLSAYAPKERAVYLYSCAESLFHLGYYDECMEYYRQALPIVEGNDKADVLFHTAFAYYLKEQITEAYPIFIEAHDLYKQHTHEGDELHTARLQQTETMLKGMRRLLGIDEKEAAERAKGDQMPEKAKEDEAPQSVGEVKGEK
jgi:2-amino-4-hydroxy-6-hydroxymethyldihydropteridine diphosphokinase